MRSFSPRPALADYGVIARTVDDDIEGTAGVLDQPARLDSDVNDVERTLAHERLDSVDQFFAQLRNTLGSKARWSR